MKKQLLLFLATMLTAVSAAFAQAPQPMFKIGKATTPPNYNDTIVYEIPNGEVSVYSRNCESFIYSYYEGGVNISEDKGAAIRQTYVKEDGTIWLSNPLSCFTMLSYVKAHFDEEGSIVIEGPQFIYEEMDWYTEELVQFYLVPMTLVKDELGSTYVPTEDMKYVLKKTEKGYEAADSTLMLGLATYGELVDNDGNLTGEYGYAWYGYGDRAVTLETRLASNGVTPPDGATIEEWVISTPDEIDLTKIAIDGDDLYIQGLDRGIKDAWIKAKMSGDKVTIPSGTYIGINDEWAYFSYIWGSITDYDEEYEELVGAATEEVVFSYDADNKMIILQDAYGISSLPDEYYLQLLYENVNLYKQYRNVDTPPTSPTDLVVTPYDEYWGFGVIEFNIPPYDEDDNVLDKSKLYYKVYVNNEVYTFTSKNYPYLNLSEDMQTVPYSLYDNDMFFAYNDYHVIYFNFTLPENCGVQTVYINEEGKKLYSKIVTNDSDAVDMNITDRKVVSRSFYNMQGQSVSESYNGPVVCRTIFDDGSVKVSKSLKTK